ncbi:hypothetical protein LNP07_04550 [Apilactobacillus sp. M161]|uniref:D-alanyl-D-alanine carboxypeptidase n=1 Tax=Apilactobacillus xinyiensis TaxID=2841032 RepID=A0ABT0I237_9LACO|nr:hypothetical protein [Apilactobacillus xinyiensis]MCK8624781.1 hypothetical protein [Apilactobacillus xinyiensis]
MKKFSLGLIVTVCMMSFIYFTYPNNVHADNVYKAYNSKQRSNKYKLIWSKKIKPSEVYLTGTDKLYSKNMFSMYYYKPDLINDLLGRKFMTTEKEKLYNIVDHKFYYFYKINRNYNSIRIPSNGAWVRDKWTIFPEGMGIEKYRQIASMLPGVKLDNDFQKFAYLVAHTFVDGQGIGDSDWNDPIIEKVYPKLMGADVLSDPSSYWKKYDNNFNKTMREKLYKNQISFEDYFKAVFTHSFDLNRYSKYGNKIGIYMDPKGSSLYGRIIIFFTTTNRHDKFDRY